jgi:hypothetical protein
VTANATQDGLTRLEPLLFNGMSTDEWPNNHASGRISPADADEWRNDSNALMEVSGYVAMRCPYDIGVIAMVRDATNPDSVRSPRTFILSQDRSMHFLNWVEGPIYTVRQSAVAPKLKYGVAKSTSYPHISYFFPTFKVTLNPGESLQFEMWGNTYEGCRVELPCQDESYQHGFCSKIWMNASQLETVQR